MFDYLKFGVLSGSVTVAALVAASASASVTYAGPFVGTTVTYTDVVEASADPLQDPEPLFGAPTGVTGDLLDFNPTSTFQADAPPTDTTDGSLSFTMTSNAGPLTALVISESGNYSFVGATANNELVASVLQVQVINPLTNIVIATAQDSFVEQYNTAPLETGVWSNLVSIDLTAYGLTSVDVVVNNVLQTTGTGPASTSISKTDFKVNTPEPATAALLGGLALGLLRRRSA